MLAKGAEKSSFICILPNARWSICVNGVKMFFLLEKKYKNLTFQIAPDMAVTWSDHAQTLRQWM